MEWALLIFGVLLVLSVYVDIIQTTIKNNGAGFIANAISKIIWKSFYKISGGDGKSKLLAQAGLFIIIFLILFWVVSIWIGYTLIFNFQENSLILTPSLQNTSFIEKLYFTGYSVSTLGLGDIKPNGHMWQILTVILSISGLFILTLCITYLIPVLSAVTHKRKLAAYIYFIGKSPQEIILNGWNGSDLSGLNTHFLNLAQEIIDHREKNLLYPVLHYFHSNKEKFAIPIQLGKLDEAVSIIKHSPFLSAKIDYLTLSILRQSIDEYLKILEKQFVSTTAEPPPLPQIDELNLKFNRKEDGIKADFDKLKTRRQLLNTIVIEDGWNWKQIENK